MWGLELDSQELARAFSRRAAHRGVLLLTGGPDGRVAEISPCLTIPERLLDAALDILGEILESL